MSRRIHFRTVSPEFRETIQREMPGIDKNPRYWYLFEWLAFVTHDTDKVTGYPILTSKEIAYLEDRERRVKSHRYRTADFIEGFAADVNHIELTGWDGIHGSARCVEPFEWPQAVKEAIEVELCHPSRARERVILTTGVKLHTRVVRDYRLDLRDEGMASLRDNGCDEAWDLLKYLNTQESSNRYTSILKNYPVALEAVRKLPEPIKTQQAQILHDIKDQAQPFYAAKDNTLRVFSIGNSILTLKSEIRHVLCGDWTEVDLQSAHLALAAAEWGIPEISNFLRTGVSIWASLAQYLNMELTPVLKGFLKDYLYATVYGMGRKKLCEMIRKSEFEGTIHYSKIMAHPIIILLWEARNKRMAEICAAGGAKDIFGRWIPFDDDNVVGYDAPKCLAQANQAAELWLLYPVIGLVAGKDSTPHGALITLWQHDGFSFSPNREADRGMWIRRFQQAVQERADSIGAVTHLVVKEG